MSEIFQNYADYYDLLYPEKDYAREARYVHGLLQRFSSSTRRVLDLGCGTGAHAVELAKLGYFVQGIDWSDRMLRRARSRNDSNPELSDRLAWTEGDLTSVRLGQSFDAVVSLFHVMSYQATDDAIEAAAASAAAHLVPSGVFIFDFWYGPAVVVQCPEPRIKHAASNGVELTRFAEPSWDPGNRLVDVLYRLEVRDRRSESIREIREYHRMRYFFPSEIDALLVRHSFDKLFIEEWGTGKPCDDSTWSAVCVARNITK
jgi:SAM-dependent methyltransferase